MTKEEVYDEQIQPFMGEILKICEKHNISMVGSFYLDKESELYCTSALLTEKFEPPEIFLRCAKILLNNAKIA